VHMISLGSSFLTLVSSTTMPQRPTARAPSLHSVATPVSREEERGGAGQKF
jgi:hypothetical protein